VAACQAFTEPGDEVATFTPIYPPFLHIPEQCGRKTVTVPLAADEGGFRLGVEAFERALSPRTRLLFLCQPHNPVGRVFTEEELTPLLEICRTRGVTVCSDEIHCDLILDGRSHRPVASLAAAGPERIVTLMSPGKTFNTAGLNLGFAVVPDPQMRARFSDARHYAMPHPNLLAYTAALAAYRDCEDWRQELISELKRNADRVQRAVKESMPGVQSHRVEATYLAWLDARGLGHDDPCALFRRFRVALSDGRDFGAPGFVRLNFGCPMPLLEKGLARLVDAVESCRQ
jgi:cystathionine beta-lyase